MYNIFFGIQDKYDNPEGTLILVDDPDLFYIDPLSKRVKKYHIRNYLTNIDIKYTDLSSLYDINFKDTLSHKLYNSLKTITFDNKLELIYNMKIFHTYKNILKDNIYNNTEWICTIHNTLNLSDDIFNDIKKNVNYFKDTEWDIIIIGKKEIINIDINDFHTINYMNNKNNNDNDNDSEEYKSSKHNEIKQLAVKVLEFRRLEGYIIKSKNIYKILHYFDKMEFNNLYDIINHLINTYNLNVYTLI